jgi:hypothetical protein
VIRYLARLPFRMVAAALMVPVCDLDDALCLSQSHYHLPVFMEEYIARVEAHLEDE